MLERRHFDLLQEARPRAASAIAEFAERFLGRVVFVVARIETGSLALSNV